jgi:hypothetical protein
MNLVTAARRLGIGLIAVLAGCAGPVVAPTIGPPSMAPSDASPTAEPTPIVPTGWIAFTSPRFGYTIAVPDGWQIEEIAGAGGLHPDEPGTDTFSGADSQMSVSLDLGATGQDIETYRSPVVEHYEGPEPDGHGLEPEVVEPIEMSGVDGRFRRYRLEISPYEQVILDASVIVDGRAYLVTYIDFEPDPSHEAEFRRIVATFRAP